METLDAANSKTDADNAMLAGTLDQLMRYLLTGFSHSARRAAYLLDTLSANTELGEEMQYLCNHVCGLLEMQNYEGVAHG